MSFLRVSLYFRRPKLVNIDFIINGLVLSGRLSNKSSLAFCNNNSSGKFNTDMAYKIFAISFGDNL